jgi:hypothetical protein
MDYTAHLNTINEIVAAGGDAFANPSVNTWNSLYLVDLATYTNSDSCRCPNGRTWVLKNTTPPEYECQIYHKVVDLCADTNSPFCAVCTNATEMIMPSYGGDYCWDTSKTYVGLTTLLDGSSAILSYTCGTGNASDVLQYFDPYLEKCFCLNGRDTDGNCNAAAPTEVSPSFFATVAGGTPTLIATATFTDLDCYKRNAYLEDDATNNWCTCYTGYDLIYDMNFEPRCERTS